MAPFSNIKKVPSNALIPVIKEVSEIYGSNVISGY